MDSQQNKFYTSISKYYSEIFPFKPMQLEFVKDRAGELNGKNIFDIGCATGELAFHLAKEGANVTGIDLNEDLLQQGRVKKRNHNVRFQVGNMLNLQNDFSDESFDTVICFGNTLVHLQKLELIREMLKGVFAVLKPGGHFVLQILNYDYILDQNVSELPVIETENIIFIRKYIFKENSPLLCFLTDLIIKQNKEIISNETSLLALKSLELHGLLNESNFTDIELYSNFKKESFGGKHLPLVVSCKKQ